MTDDEREDAEALRWYVPAGQAAHVLGTATRVQAGPDGIMVTVSLNGDAPLPRQTSGANQLAAHRPTRFALMMRRRRANAARKQAGQMQRPAVLPGDCLTCEGLGVVNNDRQRCPSCNGSGNR